MSTPLNFGRYTKWREIGRSATPEFWDATIRLHKSQKELRERMTDNEHKEWMESETTQDALETFEHISREFIGMTQVNTNHLNAAEMTLARRRMQEALHWAREALEMAHRPIVSPGIVVPVTDSTTEKDKI